MKKIIFLFTTLLLLSLWLCGCGLPWESAAPVKQPVIETPDPSAARIPVASSVPFVDAVASPAQAPAPVQTSEPAPTADSSSPSVQEIVVPSTPTPVSATPTPVLPASAPVTVTYAPVFAPSVPGSAGTGIVITKNPTSEALVVGGKTWFTAHAENAQTLTWQLIDPEGTLHTVPDAAARNPGLMLEVLEDDTIAVSEVPLSLNGWAIQARFDGNGDTAVTIPAYIFVGDYINAYNPVIERYRKAKNAEISHFGQANERDVSEWIIPCESVGYALVDLDRNGIPELILAGIGTSDTDAGILFDVYTFHIDKPVRICMSTGRGRYYLLSDNRIYYEGSGGASISIHEFYTLDGTKLQFQERYFCFYDSQNFGPYFYHMTQDTEHFLDRKPENYEEKIPLSDFPARREAIHRNICLPPLAGLL